MELQHKLKIALVVASFAALTILFTAGRRRKRRSVRTSCYLRDDQKPQYAFKCVLADNSYSQFKHLKLNPNKDLDVNSHPYESEILSLLENSKPEFDFISERTDLTLSDTYVWVETESQLEELLDVLNKETVFAVDTEQHSLRSFLGFTALIQISTPKEDYLVDTIALHDSMSLLRPIFANSRICKVFHGADNDILWLQRDFHIYVVNLFDTAKACEVLSKPQKSLAYLLETYCGVATNKMLQREDWRQRPLPADMVQYARTDAHYLLYIANCLLSELKQVNENTSTDDKFNFLLEASRRSNMTCLQLYSKETEGSPGESAASSISSRHLNSQGGSMLVSCKTQFQDHVRRLCAWRDLMARVHDENLRYVLSDQAIVALANQVSKNTGELYATIAQADLNVDLSSSLYLPSPSPVVCSHLDDIHCLLHDKSGDLDDIFLGILQNCIGSNGSCPLSIFNYALLVKYNLKMMTISKQSDRKNAKQISKKASRELFVQKFSCKSPVYHNCRIYANDGRLLCYCDRRKLEWYLRRELAELIADDPPAIKLLFEPKGRPEDEGNDFYIQSKKNICVGCGEGNHYLRYRIIPSCYRIHFPEHLKSHRSHDIVLLCVDCHEAAHAAAEKHKRELAAEFGIPLFVRRVVDTKEAFDMAEPSDSGTDVQEEGVSPLELRTAAMALLRHGPRMPSKRQEELMLIVMRYYGRREISEEDLEKALLVGMSPHEKRRLQKKKGLALKHSAQSVFPAAEHQNGGCNIDTSTVVNSSVDVKNHMNADSGSVSETCLPGGEVSFSDDGYAKTVQPKFNPKLSLLGHGPHGKLVVDHLLREYGEDGIRQFCQRWRQVFVAAIQPRFLPAGWDVNHSGKRDFGEFSLYNPIKKASLANE
ncbi:protein RRP6-like 3 [Benincasa hispida]|uniref:protein RRP6-like 3 n=1 Tax=Benincasa hispida TaxID=102211 RepID=UPI001900CF45|nr:protein RRP6-like 3 [Benincasa hispida]XP_038887746.1 protein RRP6-like 3 [Benincasa hispida]XP_038887747.1 protein RRP6-like 3 [Benincasa hispida]XP_038887748.1 protein RRP6-like 3 [Benincasa hispida]XP_038887749.1 protein RRP6-like 3 [Benincasa hispida]XP_038887750.1 protein RRP6-like 3 [Benincasa hispida]XP_038887751.1 protein RRP6-like 3 [Benincasa hispida]XP_038887752.1 protein RRP6-like 3 [Benincasa hispida]XP_038887753.1 protein RRP6-like 3 [Benincasa hispida]XP_038887754.1 prote